MLETMTEMLDTVKGSDRGHRGDQSVGRRHRRYEYHVGEHHRKNP